MDKQYFFLTEGFLQFFVPLNEQSLLSKDQAFRLDYLIMFMAFLFSK